MCYEAKERQAGFMNWNKEFYDQWDESVKAWWYANAQPTDSVTNGLPEHLSLRGMELKQI